MSDQTLSPPMSPLRRLAWKQPRTIALAIELFVLLLFLVLPWCVNDTLGDRVTDLFIFAILALGLNVVVGYTGLLHLGIGAFYGIGAYIAAILTINSYPFQFGFTN
jgi:branched-chain amino acid transport system permease protein